MIMRWPQFPLMKRGVSASVHAAYLQMFVARKETRMRFPSHKSFRHAMGIAVVLALFSIPTMAQAGAYDVLHAFCSKGNCVDGSVPSGGLAADQQGNLYGVTQDGGKNNAGALYELVAAGAGKWQYQVVYSFCACDNAFQPVGNLVLDTAGNIYGVTAAGRPGGVVYELPAAGRSHKLVVLYAFCSEADCTDGEAPLAGLAYAGQASGALYDGSNPLYGVTSQGGANGLGVAYALQSQSGSWTESKLYDFCAAGGTTCTDGEEPEAQLLVQGSDTLYGTAFGGTTENAGVVFKLAPHGGRWKESVVHTFCAKANCADGLQPRGSLSFDSSGNLLGVTYQGGSPCQSVCGTVFRLSPKGKETVLHVFCQETNCADGEEPEGGLLTDASGNLFGTTVEGGENRAGTVFELNNTFQIVHDFCDAANCSDGDFPEAPLYADTAGTLYGTTPSNGGAGVGGVVFSLTP